MTHYGFTVDDAPFYYQERGGEFEVAVCLSADYAARFDQLGLMVRRDERTWVKAGVEFVDDVLKASAVVTHETSDWSVVALGGVPERVWIKALRRLDALEVSYSLDGETYETMRLAYFPAACPLRVGMTAACPDGDGFEARFTDFAIRHVPDARRAAWLAENAD